MGLEGLSLVGRVPVSGVAGFWYWGVGFVDRIRFQRGFFGRNFFTGQLSVIFALHQAPLPEMGRALEVLRKAESLRTSNGFRSRSGHPALATGNQFSAPYFNG